MVGHLDKSAFDPDKNYDSFYAGHSFEPFPEEYALTADLLVPRVAWALDIAREIEAKRILDLCCLDGFASLTIASQLGIPVVGVDLSEDGIEMANRRAKDLPATYLHGSVEHFTSDQRFDLILLFEAIEHFTDVDKVIGVIKQHLSPNGTLLVSTPDAEGVFGIGNDDPCHLRIYSHRDSSELDKLTGSKPIVSLPDYLREQGFSIVSNEVFNGLIHTRAVLR
jgi:2-polyprenyl-3-methyl-5-hydroxy-6-metoxy-1,4-benzoquinol methylase